MKHLVVSPEKDPGMEAVLMEDEKADDNPAGLKTEEPDEYDIDEPVVDGHNGEKQQQNNKPDNIAIGMCAFLIVSMVSPAERKLFTVAASTKKKDPSRMLDFFFPILLNSYQIGSPREKYSQSCTHYLLFFV